MNFTRRRLAGVMGILLVCVMSAAAISPARAAGTIVVDLTGTTYVGGLTQQLNIDAYVTDSGSPYNTAPTRTYQIYYANKTAVSISGSGDSFLAGSGGHYTASIPLILYDAGNYYVSVYMEKDASNWDMQNKSFTIMHVFSFIGVIGSFYDPGEDILSILSVPFFTSQDIDGDTHNDDDLVPQASIATKQYVIYDAGGNPVREGDLTFTAGNWGASADVKWLNGNFTVGARFKLVNGTNFEAPAANRYSFQRNNATELYIIIISIIVAAAVVIFTTIGIYNKRHSASDLGKKEKKKEKKEIKVLEISKEDIKKAKTGKAPPPKEEVKEETKGVTKKSGDLIFEVPKWEEGDADK